MIKQEINGIDLFRFELLADAPNLRHAFCGRRGGVSRVCYASLNAGLHVDDDPAAVLENRRRFGEAAGFDFSSCVVGEQVHSGEVAVVSAEDSGKGAHDHAEAVAGIDGLVCAAPNVPLMALSADCPLVVLYDPVAVVAGLVHAGWRSTAAGIVRVAVEKMKDRGAHPENIMAGIGPSVGKCCYAVRADFKAAMQEHLPHAENFIACEGDTMFFDLPGAVAAELKSSGIERVEEARICTACNDDIFFSYRASGGTTGRFAAAVEIVC